MVCINNVIRGQEIPMKLAMENWKISKRNTKNI